jgi:hypothetical protein
MKLYAIKRKGYDAPYKVSYEQNTGLYLTYDGCLKAVKYMIREFKTIHKEDVTKDYQILEYEFDFNNYKILE